MKREIVSAIALSIFTTGILTAVHYVPIWSDKVPPHSRGLRSEYAQNDARREATQLIPETKEDEDPVVPALITEPRVVDPPKTYTTQNEQNPSDYRFGKIELNLNYILQKNSSFSASNNELKKILQNASNIDPKEIFFPAGFRLSLRFQPNCTTLAAENFELTEPDEQAKTLLVEGHDAFVSASLKQSLHGDELMETLNRENCVGTAEADVYEEMSSVSLIAEPLTNSTQSSAYYILQNAGLVSLFSVIDESAFEKVTANLGIVDTGVNTKHPDLKSITTGDLDDYGHGTMVAGVAAAPANGIGTMGSMPFDVKIKSYKVNMSDSGNAYSTTISNGILRATYDGMDVINVSWSGFSQGNYNSAIATAVKTGSLVVGAAGNFGQYVSTNITAAGSIAVGALNGTTSQMANYSNYGPGVELYTPGTYMTTMMSGGYALGTGTSFAAPLVAGMGLMVRAWGKSHNYTILPATIESILESTASTVSTVHGSVKKLNPLAVLQYMEKNYR